MVGEPLRLPAARRDEIEVADIRAAEIRLEDDVASVRAEVRVHLPARHPGQLRRRAARGRHRPDVIGARLGGLESDELAVGRDVELLDPDGSSKSVDWKGRALRESSGQKATHQ